MEPQEGNFVEINKRKAAVGAALALKTEAPVQNEHDGGLTK